MAQVVAEPDLPGSQSSSHGWVFGIRRGLLRECVGVQRQYPRPEPCRPGHAVSR